MSPTTTHLIANNVTAPGLKRHKGPAKSGVGKNAKRSCHVEERVAPPSSSPSSSVHREPSAYDNLLVSLQSGNRSLVDVYRLRQRQAEGKSDSEEDVDEVGNSESLNESEEEDLSELGTTFLLVADHQGLGFAPDTRGQCATNIGLKSQERRQKSAGTLDENDASEPQEDPDSSETDEEENVDDEDRLVNGAFTSKSSFNLHLGYELSDQEVESLQKQKSKYKWEVPAADMSNCKWVGTGECFLKDVSLNASHGLNKKLYEHWLDVYKKSGGSDFSSSKQSFFFSLCNSYRDILHSNKKPFYHKGWEEDSSIMDAYLMHSLNHIFGTRDLVKKNEAKLPKHQDSSRDELITNGAFLDHGFTRPKVLMLLPFRNIALRVIKRLIQLTPPAHKASVEYSDRFFKEYGAQDDEANDDGLTKDVGNSSSRKSSKPSDHQALFNGNCDDGFMIGIKFTKKSIKLYNEFYSSDIIVASPLQLHTKIEEAEVNKEKDVDYLSSIEVLVIDHADVISMQNWTFLNSVLEHLNCIPSKQHGTDIMRIRKWYLDGHARYFRQSIVLSYYVNPDINSTFSRLCTNYQGKVKLVCEHKGVLPKVLLQVKQIYERFDASSIMDVDDARLEYFTKKVYPRIKDSLQGGVMLFISSYFEFVRIRNYLRSQDASFCLLGDYTEQKDISRARVWFFEGTQKIMLYTERAHFYHRYKIRGIQNLIIYSLPERKEFYPEIVNMLEGSDNMKCTVLFSRFDQLRLERIVGAAPARKMFASEKGVFAFC